MSGSKLTSLDPLVMPTADDLTYVVQGGKDYQATSVQVVAGGTRGTGDESVQIGTASEATDANAAAFGPVASASAEATVAIGYQAIASKQTGNIAIGANSVASGYQSTAIGPSANASGNGLGGVAVGHLSSSTKGGSAIGYKSAASGYSASAVGPYASAAGQNASAFGFYSSAAGASSVAAGEFANANATYSIAIGKGSLANAENAVAIGYKANASFANSVAIGNVTVGAANTLALPIGGSTGDMLTKNSNGWAPHTVYETIAFVIDGGGSAITTGIKGDLEIGFDCTITAARLLADQTGSIVVDVWKDTYGNFPPTDADSITSSTPPTISSAIKSENTTLTNWITSVTAGNILRFNVDSVTTIQRVTLSLTVKRT